jgi:CRP/FNR family transcriptional regulator, cyclic AMP receptor protein
MQQDVFLSLKKIPFFSPLTENVLFALADKARTVQFPKNAIILHQGELSHSLHIILSGKVRVYVSNEENEFVLQTQEASSYFGELALLTNAPRSASIMAMEKTACAVITQADFTL